jgi:site-specific DNA recombinase
VKNRASQKEQVSTVSLRGVGYARVSTEKQAQSHTIDSQVAAIKERMLQDGLNNEKNLCFCDDGYSGDTLERPGLEQVRDQVAAGAVDRLYVHSPDRLARKHAYAMLLMDEFRRAGVEVVFLNHEVDPTPEGELLLQVQGVIAEYERAKILERNRRGRRQAAKRGAVSVFSRAPYGYRYIAKARDGADARFEVIPEEATVVRQVFEWFVRDRLSISAIARRLKAGQIKTRTGKETWGGNVVWRILTHPAYQGRARFGRYKTGPRLPRAMAFWQPPSRRSFSVQAGPIDQQIEVPVPALVSEELFAAAAEQLEENRRRSRLGPRGMRRMLQGLLVCQQCGHALCYHGSGPRDKDGVRRGFYYRCTGLDSHRWGGQKICSSRAVRAELLEQAVWDDVCSLLREPKRLEQEYRRRLGRSDTARQRASAPTLALRQRVQQSIVRLIDAYQDGMMSKEEVDPRLHHARERLARLEQEAAAIEDAEAERAILKESLKEFGVFAKRVRSNLSAADLPTKMRILRWLVKRIEVDRDDVRIIYKVSPPPTELGPASPELQHRSKRQSHRIGHSRKPVHRIIRVCRGSRSRAARSRLLVLDQVSARVVRQRGGCERAHE